MTIRLRGFLFSSMTLQLRDAPCDCVQDVVWPGAVTVNFSYLNPGTVYIPHPGYFSSVQIPFDQIERDNLGRGVPTAQLPDGVLIPFDGLYQIYSETRVLPHNSATGMYRVQTSVEFTLGSSGGCRGTGELTPWTGSGPFRPILATWAGWLLQGTLLTTHVFVDHDTPQPPLRIYSSILTVVLRGTCE